MFSHSASDLQGCAPSVCRLAFGRMRQRIVIVFFAIGVVVGHQPSSKSHRLGKPLASANLINTDYF
uniref:Uncharacterized protein n=1 Tax=Solanum lycopersicum TaxID=4081 RepID=A0A3Q7GI65_SOLLC